MVITCVTSKPDGASYNSHRAFWMQTFQFVILSKCKLDKMILKWN